MLLPDLAVTGLIGSVGAYFIAVYQSAMCTRKARTCGACQHKAFIPINKHITRA
ncbi:hypothetical protein LIPSTDRAFT_69032 [Lipomyces starkeyi NRRL Y-11557]|uniref:Uncharacterized protein n=1 Tax=Lipomyces starkeyi NRRL Y-11557 TaxID=675824 RepID=A0A1E3QB56_LIPST|nr:hypothetical protein LIPSTDRAFT_69032 [Lipomyces starkeyi NRRL Y-11557]